MSPLRRPIALLGAALLALALGACGVDRRAVGQGGFVLGETLSIYLSLPREQPTAEAMVDGAKLALADAHGKADAWKVNLAVLDDSADDGGTDPAKAVDNALQAVKDGQTVAYVGDLDSGAARRTAPLLNGAGVLQVSPGAGDPGLTEAGADEPGDPQRFAPAGEREGSYVRLVASDRALAPTLVDAARAGGGPLLIERGPGRAAAAVSDALLERARAAGLRTTTSERRAGAVIYAGDDARTAAATFESVHRSNPRALLVGGDALARSELAGELPRSARARLRLVSNAPALDPGLKARFRARYGRTPSPYAAIGYEAVQLVLDGIRRAGDQANVRPRLNEAVRGLRRRGTLLGDYAIDARSGATDRVRTTVLRGDAPARP